MTSLQKLKEFGESIGLKGDDLYTFIKEQQAEERAARVSEREQSEKDRAFQLEQQKLEQQAKKELMELELSRMRIEKAAESEDADDTSDPYQSHNIRPPYIRPTSKMPKLPYFDENIDCMDAYLNRFEKVAMAQGWKKYDLSICLSALLKGKALEVYSRLPPEQANDYDCLKQALLKRYQLTEDGFKRKFRTARPEVGESPAQFLGRLASYLQRWVELAKVEQTFEGLASLMLREQYLSVCPQDLALFLKERATTDIDELAKLAEQYSEAHHESLRFKRSIVDHSLRTKEMTLPLKRCHRCGSDTHLIKDCRMKAPETKTSPKRYSGGQKTCFICGKSNHLARNCFHRASAAAMQPRISNYNNGQPTKSSSDQDDVRSHQCSALHSQFHRSSYSPLHSPPRSPLHHSPQRPLMSDEIELKCGCKLPIIADGCQDSANTRMPVTEGWIGDKCVTVLRDTGCSTIVVRESLVSNSELTGEKTLCVLIDGTVRKLPVANVSIETSHLTGTVKAICMKQPLYDLIIGNVEGVKDNIAEGQAVETRQQSKKKIKPLPVPPPIDTEISELVRMQKEDESLKHIWQKIQSTEASTEKPDSCFTVCRDLLYRRNKRGHDQSTKQLVLPVPLRTSVMKLAHDSIMGGHQGISRTSDRVSSQFWWPGMNGDVHRFCKSCDICQRTIAKGRIPKVPLGNVPLIDTPFKRVAVDIVGPIFPASDRGNRYLLTLVDYATRYPEAVALKNVETETVAEALVSIFARVGIPTEILSDQGAQFMSHIMKEVCRLLSIKQLTTTPYHPQCNGLVERYNGTLKTMLKRMCAERPKDWDRYVDALLFAYRELPQESLHFSPFEMLYGHSVRGPMIILKELWTKEQENPDVKSTYEYVINLRQRLQDTCDLAHENLLKAQKKQKKYYDHKTKERCFKAGDKVLLLLPTDENKLLMQWKGPFTILERVNDRDYLIQLPTKARLFHANMLKKYYEREQETTEITGAAILEPEDDEEEISLQLLSDAKETWKDVKVNDQLSTEQKKNVEEILYEYQDIFTDIPKTTNLGEHQITLTTDEPIRGKAYPLPHAMKEVLDKEIDSMLKMKVIEPSTASYASPVVMVKKPDGSTRVCVDYRKLNSITVFDPEPIPSAEEIFAKLAGSKYYSKFDLTKGYWQIPMNNEDKDLTTFICHCGLFRFTVMPFGLVNAPATFSRIMRRLLRDSSGLDNYLDDVLAHSGDWEEHLRSLRDFFERVKQAKLTLRPTKCEIGEFDISFLGHRVSENELQPKLETVDKVLQAPIPSNKKQLRAFLGLVGFYRRFIPNFATIALPLTNATRKGAPNQLQWEERHEKAFQELKLHLVNPPILRLPNLNKVFVLQTDASDVGIGAVLAQEDEHGIKHPVAFASRKLLPRESRYSTIERECLAIVWGVTKFQEYLYGKEFILETDHRPLQFLGNAQFQNGRLMRWALALQPYRFVVRAIHGRENVGADFLSRFPCDSH